MPNATSVPDEIALPTVYSSLISQSALHLATNPLYHRLISTTPPTVDELLSLQRAIDDWEQTIPNYFQLNNPDFNQQDWLIQARYRLSWRSWNIRIILFRPVVLRWAAKRWKVNQHEEEDIHDAKEEQCRLLCLQSARKTITSISEYMANNVPARLGSWYMLLVPASPNLFTVACHILFRMLIHDSYFIFQAGLIPIIFLITTPTSPSAPSWLNDLRVTKDLLSHAAVGNRLAGRCLEVIDRLCAPLLDAEQPEAILEDPGLFQNVHSIFEGEQGDGMEFLDWSNIGPRWGV